jgi:curved DNA-binding protein CbpA
MKSLDELDYYEILELPTSARSDEIERAYQLTRAAYAKGSMALYSLFSESDAEVIRSRIDEAYRILANPDERKNYDTAAGISRDANESLSDERGDEISFAASDGVSSASGPASRPGTVTSALGNVPTAMDVFEELDADIEEDEHDFGGAGLRRARLRRGIELSQIADVTKVSNSYLRRIEAEEFSELPAAVYVRGFVMAYARAIGLDPARVAASYMERVKAAEAGPEGSGVAGQT